jgi:hypothetical protein
MHEVGGIYRIRRTIFLKYGYSIEKKAYKSNKPVGDRDHEVLGMG